MTKDQIIEIIRDKANGINNKVVEHRRIVHSNPELSCREFETSKYISTVLENLDIPHSFCTETSVVGLIGKGLPCVALRADIDALPIIEETRLPFSSKNLGIMHACGHDMHIAMLLGAAEILKGIESELRGSVKLIFQHSEELLPGGAIEMIEKGVLDNPKPSYVFGQHIDPSSPAGHLYFAPGAVMASSDELYWTLHGSGSHAAQPHLAKDPIVAASALIQHFQTMLNKNRNPLNPAVLSVTAINGGSATNIFPDEVKMLGTLRTFDESLRTEMHQLIEEQSKSICQLYGVECIIEIKKGYPPLINNEDLAKKSMEIAQTHFSDELVHKFEPKMWAEDFAYFARSVPSVFWFLGAKENVDEPSIPLHNSKLSPSETALRTGTEFLAVVAVSSLFEI